jgi:magnesium chelatase family protein
MADAAAESPAETTAEVAARVWAARLRADARGVEANAELQPWQLEIEAPLENAARRLIERAIRGGRLTGRGFASVRRVALTIADLLGDVPPLASRHVSMALALRTEPSFLIEQVAS